MSVSPIIKPPFYQSLLNPTHPLARHLILKWMMNEETGDGLLDITRNGNNGAVTGAVWGAGGLTLDGTNDLVTRARLTGLTNWTVHIKFTPEDVTNIKNPIIDQGDILIKQRDDDIVYGVTSDLEIDYTSMVTACLVAGSPVDILVTRDGTTMVCYVYDTNGELYTDTFVVAGTANTSRTNFILGSQSRTAFLYPAMRPANMTGEKSLLMNASDDVQYAKGSRSLNSAEVTECWNANQKSVLIWIDPLNFTPGDGQTHYLFENQGTSTTTNREILRISDDGTLSYFVRDKDTTAHTVIADVTGWAIGERHQIFVTLDFAADSMALYVDGALADDAGHDLSSDSIDEIEATVHVGSGSSASHQVNIGMTIQVFNRIWSLAEITANYDSGDGTPFVVTPDTILMTRYSKEDNGIVFHHSGMFVTESDSAGDLTDVTGCVTRFAVDDAVNFYGGCGEAITGPCIVLLSAGTRVRVHSGTAFADISGGQKFYRSDGDFPESGIIGANNLTIQGWIFLPNITGLKFLVTKWGAAGDRMYNFGILGDVLYFAVSDDGTNGFYNYSSSTIEVNRWVHVAIVYTAAAGTVDFYINGHFISQGDTVDHSIADKDPPFTIGTWSGDTSNYSGYIFNIALFDDKRTAAEILASANDWDIDLSAEGNLIGQWMFNEAADAAAIDNTEGDAGRDLIPWDDGDVTFDTLRSVVGGYVQNVEKVGKSLGFDGSEYVTVSAQLVAGYPFTLAVWAKTDIAGGAFITLLDISTSNVYYHIWTDGDGFVRLTARNVATSQVITSVNVVDGKYHHIVGVYTDPTTRELFVDGISVGANAVNVAYNTDVDSALIGLTRTVAAAGYLDGQMPQAQVYNIALTDADILYLATHPNATEAEIITNTTVAATEMELYHNYRNGNLLDLTAHGNDGIHSGSASYVTAAFVTKDHLLTDENGGIGGVSNIDSTWTVTKDTTVKFMDSRSLLGVCAAGDDGDEFTIWSPTLVTGEDYWQTIRVWIPTIHDDTTLHLDVDGAATPITSIEVGKSLSDDNHFARDFNLAETYYAQAANNTIHQITTEDVSVGLWINSTDVDYGALVRKKNNVTGDTAGYALYLSASGRIIFNVGDGADDYAISTGPGINYADGKWHHIACILDRSDDAQCKIFVDGNDATGSTSGAVRLALIGSLTNANTFGVGEGNLLTGRVRDIKIYYAAGVHWSDAEALYQYNNPSDVGGGAGTITDNWLCNDNTNSTVVVGAVNNLIASANTDVFAEEHWKRYDICWKADQPDIEINLSVTGAGAASNEVEVNVDAGQLRVNLIENGGMEGTYAGGLAPAWLSYYLEDGEATEENVDVHSGSAAQLLTLDDDSEGITQLVAGHVVDDYYTLSFWVKVTAGTLIVYYNDVIAFTITSCGWTQYELTYKVASESLYLIFYSSTSATAYIDDVSVLKADKANAVATRIRDFAGGRIDGLEIHNAAIPAVGIKRLRDLPHEMLL